MQALDWTVVKTTSLAAMRYYLNLPTMKERHKIAQVQVYLFKRELTNPLHEKIRCVLAHLS